jgi:homoserine dehydrogenase
VVTCEKGALANYWQTLEPFLPLIGYSATVGGGTKMLTEISNYKNKAEIQNITAVVNGTLNYISSSFKEGKKEGEILQEVLLGGYAEPGANDFESIVQGELKDVVKKAVIIANHSELLDRVVKLTDVNISFNGINDLRTKRCIVKIDQNKVEAGFIEDTFASWLPSGVDNTLFINGKEVKTGPGAGADPTTHVMISDMENLMN